MKIDTEGAEYTIIKDLVQSNTIRYVSQMIIECHDTHTSQTATTLIS